MKKRIWIVLALLCYGARCTLLTKPSVCRTLRSERSIYDVIRRHKVAVAYLYFQETGYPGKYMGRTKHMQRDFAQRPMLQQSFTSLSKSGYYPKNAVAFVQINGASENGKKFLQDNDLSGISMPSVVLFTDGTVVQDQNGPVVLAGALNRRELKKKIDSYIDLDIAQYVEQERVCKRYEGIMRDRMHVYYSPYFSSVANPWNDYWGWPYYGMAQGNYGGNVGVVMGNGGMSFFGSNY